MVNAKISLASRITHKCLRCRSHKFGVCYSGSGMLAASHFSMARNYGIAKIFWLRLWDTRWNHFQVGNRKGFWVNQQEKTKRSGVSSCAHLEGGGGGSVTMGSGARFLFGLCQSCTAARNSCSSWVPVDSFPWLLAASHRRNSIVFPVFSTAAYSETWIQSNTIESQLILNRSSHTEIHYR